MIVSKLFEFLLTFFKSSDRNLTKAWKLHLDASRLGFIPSIQILRRNEAFDKYPFHEATRNAIFCLLCIRKFCESDLDVLPYEIVKMITQELWKLRNDDDWNVLVPKETIRFDKTFTKQRQDNFGF